MAKQTRRSDKKSAARPAGSSPRRRPVRQTAGSSEDAAQRLSAMEEKVAELEKRLASSQQALAGKLAEALQSLTHQEAAQDAKVSNALRGLSIELSDIRDRLMAVLGPQTVH